MMHKLRGTRLVAFIKTILYFGIFVVFCLLLNDATSITNSDSNTCPVARNVAGYIGMRVVV